VANCLANFSSDRAYESLLLSHTANHTHAQVEVGGVELPREMRTYKGLPKMLRKVRTAQLRPLDGGGGRVAVHGGA